MTWMILSAAAAGLMMALAHTVSVAIALVRCRPRALLPALPGMPAVSIIRPVCGIDNFAEETLRSAFRLDYPDFELIFCVAQANDPAARLIKALIAEHPGVPARLLIGDERISSNPKLNNMVKGWREARHGWIVFADSNVLMPRDYIQHLLLTWRGDTGLVCTPPAGCMPEGFWAELECAFLNGYQARWQYFADTLGRGFAQGKNMLWRRADLEAAGGIRALASELAEDAAATKLVRASGHRVRLSDAPFGQPLGTRELAEVWQRQLRWARLRRASFVRYFLLEPLTGGLLPLTIAVMAAPVFGYPAWLAATACLSLWYGSEALLVRIAGWPLSWRTPLLAVLRDLILPILWLAAWGGNGFVWRGNQMRIAEGARSS